MRCCFSQRQEITLLEKRRHSLNFPVWGKPNFMLRIFIFSNFVFIFSWKDHLYFAWLEYLYFQTLYSCFHDKDVYMIKVLIFLFLSYLIKVQGISYHAEMFWIWCTIFDKRTELRRFVIMILVCKLMSWDVFQSFEYLYFWSQHTNPCRLWKLSIFPFTSFQCLNRIHVFSLLRH